MLRRTLIFPFQSFVCFQVSLYKLLSSDLVRCINSDLYFTLLFRPGGSLTEAESLESVNSSTASLGLTRGGVSSLTHARLLRHQRDITQQQQQTPPPLLRSNSVRYVTLLPTLLIVFLIIVRLSYYAS